tara:strand:- start:365350 stop:366519 length:1170 start_codon:yes stop_codon:yes gene_type:complete
MGQILYLFSGIILLIFVSIVIWLKFTTKDNLEDSNGRKQIIPIWVLMLFATLIGIVLVILGSLVEVNFIPTPSWNQAYKSLVVSIMHNLGQALFVAGLVGLIFEIKSIKNYFEKRISDILIDDEYLKHQDYNELMRLRQRATKNIYSKKSKEVDPELIELDEQICHRLTEPYFEFFQETATCSFSDDRTYLIKKVKTRFRLVNPQKKTINVFTLFKPKIRFKKIAGVEDNDIRKLEGFDIWVDGEKPNSIMDVVEVKAFPEKMYDHDEEYSIKTEIGIKKGFDKVLSTRLKFQNYFEALIVEERKIPLNDHTYFFRLETSAKNFKIGLVFDNDNIEIDGNLFGTMSNPRNGIFIDKDSNSIAIESKRWMLKGNGAYINIIPKNWTLKKI